MQFTLGIERHQEHYARTVSISPDSNGNKTHYPSHKLFHDVLMFHDMFVYSSGFRLFFAEEDLLHISISKTSKEAEIHRQAL